MQYLSTRDPQSPPRTRSFERVLLAGLAEDGGLYVPERFPVLDREVLCSYAGMSYAELAGQTVKLFAGNAFSVNELQRFAEEAYHAFRHAAVTPLAQLDHRLWLLELFHGPTLAFKDLALQFVGLMFDAALARRGDRVTIIGATSGDTGSAALEACRDSEAIDIFILYPHDRVSEVQRRQMTTIGSVNAHAIAVEGTFDDCQDLVKALFADAQLCQALNLAAVNSINWARIAAQTIYYFAAGAALGAPHRSVSFSVPTGNFGNVYAAHVARRIGLPIAELVIGTNRNDILARFINEGAMTIHGVEPSLSPSMDIQVSSNFERLLFELKNRDGAAVASALAEFRRSGTLPASAAEWRSAQQLFTAHRIDDDATRAEIAETWRTTGELIDPHSAVAVAAAKAGRRDPAVPMVALACAHPAKFPEAVESAAGRRPALPPRLADLLSRPERSVALPNDVRAVEEYVRAHARPTTRPMTAGGAA